MNKRKIITFILLLSFLGLIDSTYLAIKHYSTSSIPCPPNIKEANCDIVTNSTYSTVGPIPLAVFGMFYYLTLIILSYIYLKIRHNLLSYIQTLTIIGFFVSLVLVYIQLFVLKSSCSCCVASAVITPLLIISAFLLKRTSKN